MARVELVRLRSPIGECETFVAASGTRTAGTFEAVGDVLVCPLETTSSAAGVVLYKAPKIEVKKTGEAWTTGQKVFWRVDHDKFTINTGTEASETPTGIVVEAAAENTTYGVIMFDGTQLVASSLDTNPSA